MLQYIKGAFFQIPDPVRVQRNPVMPLDHLARHFRMHRVRIIQQGRPEQREAAIQKQPQAGKREQYLS